MNDSDFNLNFLTAPAGADLGNLDNLFKFELPNYGPGYAAAPGGINTDLTSKILSRGFELPSYGPSAAPTGANSFLNPTTLGYASLGLQGFGSLANAFLGYKQYQVAKDMLRENKRQFNMNWDAQRTLTNAQLRDRQEARVASNPNAYQPVDVYMDQNRIK